MNGETRKVRSSLGVGVALVLVLGVHLPAPLEALLRSAARFLEMVP